MTYIAVGSCRVPRKTDLLHHFLYHGTARRSDPKFEYPPVHHIDDSLSDPLLITKSGRIWPRVILPEMSLVLSEDARNMASSKYPQLTLLPVVFEKLIDAYYATSDFSYFDREDYKQDPYAFGSDTILERYPDCPELQPNSNYYELVVQNRYHYTRLNPSEKQVAITYFLKHTVDGRLTESIPHSFIDEEIPFWARAIFLPIKFFETIFDKIDTNYFTYDVVRV